MDQKILKNIQKIQDSFEYFVFNIFSQSFPGFVGGQHLKNIAEILQNNNRTARISARDHFKSTSLYAFIMWRIWCDWDKNIEAHYFSYSQGMSAYHIEKIKTLISINPFFDGCVDHKPTADSIIKYSWDGIHFFKLDPVGLLKFKRGIHCEDIYVDDPFQDPDNKMLLTKIVKINNVVKNQLMEMPNRFFHVVGTPQTFDDFFFNKDIMSRFKVSQMPAVKDWKNKVALWPEFRPWEELMSRKLEKGEKVFNLEYMCQPMYAEEAYFNRNQLMEVVNPDLKNLDIKQKHELDGEIIGGLDIGKKSHPSHIIIFQFKKGKWKQLYQAFWDHMDYVKQIEWCEILIEKLGIDYLYYDATRGELEGLLEQNKLPTQMKPVNFNTKTKFDMATQFDIAVSNKNIELINDRRFIDQILMVTNDLEALETVEGHADSFWSTCLCFNFLLQPKPNIRFL